MPLNSKVNLISSFIKWRGSDQSPTKGIGRARHNLSPSPPNYYITSEASFQETLSTFLLRFLILR